MLRENLMQILTEYTGRQQAEKIHDQLAPSLDKEVEEARTKGQNEENARIARRIQDALSVVRPEEQTRKRYVVKFKSKDMLHWETIKVLGSYDTLGEAEQRMRERVREQGPSRNWSEYKVESEYCRY